MVAFYYCVQGCLQSLKPVWNLLLVAAKIVQYSWLQLLQKKNAMHVLVTAVLIIRLPS